MMLAIMQPYFLPYIGYWQLIDVADTFVIYDDVNYINKGYINRNSISSNGKLQKFTLELIGASQNKLINEIEIGSNCLKLLKTFELNYKKAPQFKNVFPIFEDILNQKEKKLSKFIEFSLIKVSNYLGINTKFIFSSEIDKDNTLKAQSKLIDICQKLKARFYISAINGIKLYDKKKFQENNISLSFLDTEIIKYQQSRDKFLSHLSIIDVMMYNDISNIKKMLKKYKFV